MAAAIVQAPHVVRRIFIESIIYGMSLILFAATVYVLCVNRRVQRINRPMLIVACLFFSLSTAHIALSLRNILIWFANGASYDFHTTTHVSLSMDMTYASQTLLADAVVMYRCYVVWQSRLVVVLPILLWLTLVTCTVRIVTIILNHTSEYMLRQAATWQALYYSVTFCTNVISTGLLAYRIWKINRDVSRAQMRVMKSRLTPIMNICLDAGLLYTATLTIAIVLFAINSPETFAIQDLLAPLIAITFYMVIIRISIANNTPPSMFSIATPFSSQPQSSEKTTVERTVGTYAPQLCTTDTPITLETTMSDISDKA